MNTWNCRRSFFLRLSAETFSISSRTTNVNISTEKAATVMTWNHQEGSLTCIFKSNFIIFAIRNAYVLLRQRIFSFPSTPDFVLLLTLSPFGREEWKRKRIRVIFICIYHIWVRCDGEWESDRNRVNGNWWRNAYRIQMYSPLEFMRYTRSASMKFLFFGNFCYFPDEFDCSKSTNKNGAETLVMRLLNTNITWNYFLLCTPKIHSNINAQLHTNTLARGHAIKIEKRSPCTCTWLNVAKWKRRWRHGNTTLQNESKCNSCAQ